VHDIIHRWCIEYRMSVGCDICQMICRCRQVGVFFYQVGHVGWTLVHLTGVRINQKGSTPIIKVIYVCLSYVDTKTVGHYFKLCYTSVGIFVREQLQFRAWRRRAWSSECILKVQSSEQ
jgi:hypothetical protein